MMMRSYLVMLGGALASFGAAIGCGDSGDAGTGASGGSGGGAGGSECGLAPATNAEFCTPGASAVDCSLANGKDVSLCGVALDEPPGDLARATGVKEFGGSGAPNVACFTPAGYPDPPGTSATVTVEGIARIFSQGCNSHDVSITFYKVLRDGSANDGQLGEAVGTTVITDADCATTGEQTETDDCSPRYECKYSYPNVPSEVELAVKTTGPVWQDLIQYNVFISNSEVVDGKWDHNVRALAQDDYGTIPQVAIGGPVQNGHGVVAGEVHDCDDIRLSNAVVGINKPSVGFTYFTSDEDSPLPQLEADGTSILGLYAALDVVEGPVTVSAAGTLGGQVVALGQHRVWVYPDTVTSVTFKGLRPYQVPQ